MIHGTIVTQAQTQQAKQELATGHADAAHQGTFLAECETCRMHAMGLGIDLTAR